MSEKPILSFEEAENLLAKQDEDETVNNLIYDLDIPPCQITGYCEWANKATGICSMPVCMKKIYNNGKTDWLKRKSKFY